MLIKCYYIKNIPQWWGDKKISVLFHTKNWLSIPIHEDIKFKSTLVSFPFEMSPRSQVKMSYLVTLIVTLPESSM